MSDALRDQLCELFRAHGYDGATMSLISETTGLGRASLYHHFPGGKEAMVEAALEHLGQAVQAELLGPLREDGPPRRRLERWARGLARIYDDGRKNCLLAALVLSGAPERFKPAVAGAFRALLEALTDLLVEAGVKRADARRRAEDALARVQGSLVLARGLDDMGVFGRVVGALPDELLD